jgi:hypothetical protein
MSEYQCDAPLCTNDGDVYGYCVDCAPERWIPMALDELDLPEAQETQLRRRLKHE